MENTHYYYIIKCIRSCNTLLEIDSCYKMIITFNKRFKNNILTKDLRMLAQIKKINL